MASNSQIQIVGTDFDEIKLNLLTFLKSQNILKDADYSGSVLSILLDILAYNTHYNSYYLNMVANEMFLDSATKRSSIISHTKMLGYTPRSKIAPTAIVNLEVLNYELSSIIIPKFSKFLSEPIDGTNYVFITTQDYIANNDDKNSPQSPIYINDVIIKQGEPVTYTFTYNIRENPRGIFKIPESNIDIETLEVVVQKSRLDASLVGIFDRSSAVLDLTPDSEVYFIQESLDGYYEIYFGDGVLGKKLTDGNVVILSYIVTDGIESNKAKNFTFVGGNEYLASGTISVNTVSAASGGKDRESIDSIKFIAPKAYSAQNRAVTNEDYIALINNNSLGFSFDSVNVWGGQENIPPVYGQIFVALKPQGGYTLTTAQKQLIRDKLIKPMNVITVEPNIIDPDYTYIKIVATVIFDPKKTLLNTVELANKIKSAVQNFSNITLNTFNSTFSLPDLLFTIQDADPSVITNECDITLQKKFLPSLSVPVNYELDFDCALQRGILSSGISSSPGMQFFSNDGTIDVINDVYLEEIPSYSGGIESINIVNPGFGYKQTPTVNIIGDGYGANAYAIIVNGSLHEIVVDQTGANYTQATVEIVGGGGNLGSGVANVQGRYGTIKSYYYNSKNIKSIFNENSGTIDYIDGKVNLNNFNPLNVANPLAQLTLSVKPKSNIIYSSKNKILTVDPYDPSAIIINVKAR